MVHSSSIVRIAKALPDTGKVHSLTDMDVEEVSMVDRAANKRKFLTIKRDAGDHMTTEVRPNGKGGFTQKNGAGKTPTKKAALEVPPGYKEMVGPILTKASEMLDQLASDLDGSSPADVGDDGSVPGVPADFANGLQQVCQLLDKAGTMFPASAPDPDADTEDAPPPQGDGGADEATEMQMRAAADNFAKIFGVEKVSKSLRANLLKVGAKMSKERFNRLHQAYQVLGTLIGELGPSPAAAAPAAPGAPTIGKAKPPKKPMPDEEDTTKVDDTPMTKALASLTSSVVKIAEVVKTQGAQLTELRKSRSGPAALNVEEGTPRVEKAFSWPLDVNNPITRETVDKADSFFDE